MADEMTLDEYNAAMDTMGPAIDDEVPEEPEDVGAAAIQTADALGVTEAPKIQAQTLLDQHPEIWPDYEEVVSERLIIREAYPPMGPTASAETKRHHTTYPFLTLYERTKVLAFRAAQLGKGAAPFIDVPEYMTDVYEIAKAELEAKRLPFILKRPLPNGKFEYWRLSDLMLL